MVARFVALAHRFTVRTGGIRGVVTFTEATGEVCDAACRNTAQMGRVRTSAAALRLGSGR